METLEPTNLPIQQKQPEEEEITEHRPYANYPYSATANLPQPIECSLCTNHPTTTNNPNTTTYNNSIKLQIHLLEHHQGIFASTNILGQVNGIYFSPNAQAQENHPVFTNVQMLNSETKHNCLCTLCKLTFNNPKQFLKHLTNVHLNFIRPFRTAVLIHQKTKLYKCAVCNATFHESKLLTNHITEHTEKWETKCRRCNDTIPPNKQNTQCNGCNAFPSTFYDSPKSNLYKCRLCNKTAYDMVMFHSHIALDHRDLWEVFLNNRKMLETVSPFKCTDCTGDNSIDPVQQENHINGCHQSKNTI